MFSTGTHLEALKPMRTESCSTKIVHNTTATTKSRRQPNDAGMKLCENPSRTYPTAINMATTTHIA